MIDFKALAAGLLAFALMTFGAHAYKEAQAPEPARPAPAASEGAR